MAKKKGRWVQERTYRLSPEGKKKLKPQHEKISLAAKEIKLRCEGLSGREFKTCRRQVMLDVFRSSENNNED